MSTINLKANIYNITSAPNYEGKILETDLPKMFILLGMWLVVSKTSLQGVLDFSFNDSKGYCTDMFSFRCHEESKIIISEAFENGTFPINDFSNLTYSHNMSKEWTDLEAKLIVHFITL